MDGKLMEEEGRTPQDLNIQKTHMFILALKPH